VTSEADNPARSGVATGPYWVLRVVETALLLASLVGIGMFAWSAVDILRIETAAVPTKEIPATLWPGVFIFVGAMLLLQLVRVVLGRYRRDDGSPRGDARGSAAAATAEALSELDTTAPAVTRTDTDTGA
jgi:TRAP-type C4-dicarboxylate transport system permease small subunit